MQATSYWDYLPQEIQRYIIRLAIRQHHRDQLGDVHQVLERFWDICNCGPFHLLREIHFAKKWKVLCGIRQFLNGLGASDYSSRNIVGNYHMNREHCKIASMCWSLLISVFILTLNKTSKSLHIILTLLISTGKG